MKAKLKGEAFSLRDIIGSDDLDMDFMNDMETSNMSDLQIAHAMALLAEKDKENKTSGRIVVYGTSGSMKEGNFKNMWMNPENYDLL